MTGKRIGLDTATRMASDADFSDRSDPGGKTCKWPADDGDPLEELRRLIRERK